MGGSRTADSGVTNSKKNSKRFICKGLRGAKKPKITKITKVIKVTHTRHPWGVAVCYIKNAGRASKNIPYSPGNTSFSGDHYQQQGSTVND